MKIANIIYEKELINHTEVDYVNYYKGIYEYDKLDKTLPTLYVGWSFMKACNPSNEIIQNADILRKKIIGNELYWEFNFEESKPSHVKGVQNFVDLVPQYYFVPKYNYINLDPVFFQIVDIEGLMDVLPKALDRCYLFKRSMLYVQYGNKIWGINLDMYSFFKFDVNEIIKKVEILAFNGNSENYDCVNDDDGLIYEKFYKILPNFTLLKRYLITLL